MLSRTLRPVAIAAASIIALLATLGPAAADWEIVEMDGHVKVSANGQWRELRAGERVPVGAWVKTNAKSSVTLRRVGAATVVAVKPRTMIAVAGLEGQGDRTVILQRFGKTSLDVEKRSAPHLQVRTPYLTAVVKGTTLDVSAGRRSASVDVETGEVEVIDPLRGEATTLTGGEDARAGLGRSLGQGDAGAPIVAVDIDPPSLPPVGALAPITPAGVEASSVAAAANVAATNGIGRANGAAASSGPFGAVDAPEQRGAQAAAAANGRAATDNGGSGKGKSGAGKAGKSGGSKSKAGGNGAGKGKSGNGKSGKGKSGNGKSSSAGGGRGGNGSSSKGSSGGKSGGSKGNGSKGSGGGGSKGNGSNGSKGGNGKGGKKR